MAREDIVKVSGCTTEQQARWRQAAGDAPLAAWMRHAADAAIDDVRVMPAADIDRIEAALVSVRSTINATQVGNNANQIAAALNVAVKSGLAIGVESIERQAQNIADEFGVLRDQVNEALALVRAMRP